MKKYIFYLFLLVFFPGNGVADQSLITCHCFKNRSYDAANRFAADEYILTTTFNSLIARVCSISKQQIIMKKMRGGVPADDLTVAAYIAKNKRVDMDFLLFLRKSGKSWGEIFSAPGFPPVKEDTLTRRVVAEKTKRNATKLVTDEIIRSYFKVSQKEIDEYIQAGLSVKELVFVLTMAEHSKKHVNEIMSMYQHQKKSWSEIAHDFGITAKEAGRLIYDAPGMQFPGS